MNLISKTTYGEYLTVSAPIHKWEEILDTEFYEFEVQPNPVASEKEKIRTKIHRCMQYSLPKFLRGHVSAGTFLFVIITHTFMCACMYVCMYVCVYVCMYV